MRFPPKSYNKELESAEDRRERQAQDLELAKEMAEDDDDVYQDFVNSYNSKKYVKLNTVILNRKS